MLTIPKFYLINFIGAFHMGIKIYYKGSLNVNKIELIDSIRNDLIDISKKMGWEYSIKLNILVFIRQFLSNHCFCFSISKPSVFSRQPSAFFSSIFSI